MPDIRETPKRIQRTRERGWRRPDNCVIVDRTSRYGNMFAVRRDPSRSPEWHVADIGGRVPPASMLTHRYGSRELATMAAVHLYDKHTRPGMVYELNVDQVRRDLGGKDLACPCPLPEPGEVDWCHAARTLIPLANGDSDA